MTIKTRVGLAVVDVGTADTALLFPLFPNNRLAVSAFSLYNTTGGPVIVTLYESPDSTSAAGKEIATITVATQASALVPECIGQSYALGNNIIAKADVTGANARLTVTTYDGTS